MGEKGSKVYTGKRRKILQDFGYITLMSQAIKPTGVAGDKLLMASRKI